MSIESEEATENFFTSFTDLLVGVIFMFILLLMVFALNLKHAHETPPVIITEEIRANILREIARRMESYKTPVILDLTSGVVRLPESLLFESGKSDLSPQGEKALQTLAIVLSQVLPCAAEDTTGCQWQVQPLKLDSVLIEGHTDNRPFTNAQGHGNWELSAFRALSVYKTMTAAAPALDMAIRNESRQPILGVSAYADRRPISNDLNPNRRIDLRFNLRPAGLR